MQSFFRIFITWVIILIALFFGYLLWNYYMYSAWTRDARVAANVILLSPEVSGQVAKVNVRDNQLVHKGEVLFEIDPTRYQIAADQAQMNLGTLNDDTKDRFKYDQARELVKLADYNLQSTKVRAPVDGYITNLLVHAGGYAQAGHPTLALVERNSFYVVGYFEETKVEKVHIGAPVTVELMSSHRKLKGSVESISRAIGDNDNGISSNLLANVNPTFSWVRLAQRIPVRIKLEAVPKEVLLSAGMTCTVKLVEKKH